MKETIPKKSMKSKTSFFFSFLKKINKKRPIKEKKRKRERGDTNCQYQEQKRGYHYRWDRDYKLTKITRVVSIGLGAIWKDSERPKMVPF